MFGGDTVILKTAPPEDRPGRKASQVRFDDQRGASHPGGDHRPSLEGELRLYRLGQD